MTQHSRFKNGQVLILAIIFMAVILIFSSTIFSKVSSFVSYGSKSLEKQQAIHITEAGIDSALKAIALNPNYTGTPAGTYITVGSTGEFKVIVNNVSAQQKTVEVTGYIPNFANQKSQQTIKVNFVPNTQSFTFNYATQVGDGGLSINQHGKIIGNVASLKTGANSIYGGGSSPYPIIQGDAYAAGLIGGSPLTVTGTKYQNQSTLPPMPTFDYQYWKDVAQAGGTITCPCNYNSGTTHLGPRKLNGNLTVGLGAELIIDGPLFVTGNISSSGFTRIDSSFGANGTVIIADGTITTGPDGDGGFVRSSPTPGGRLLVVTTNTNTNQAIFLRDNFSDAIFFALEGGIIMEEDNFNAPVVITKKLDIEGQTVTFTPSVQTSYFSTSPTASWKIDKGTYQFK